MPRRRPLPSPTTSRRDFASSRSYELEWRPQELAELDAALGELDPYERAERAVKRLRDAGVKAHRQGVLLVTAEDDREAVERALSRA